LTQLGRVPAQDRSKRTRLKIIETSASVLERRGYAATSLDEIAVEMGMSRGVLYHHFRSKAVLTEAVVQSHYERWDELTDRVRERELPPLMRIITLTQEVARNSRIDPVVRAGLRMQLEHAVIEGDLGHALATPYVRWIEHLTVVVAAGQAAGEIVPDLAAADLAANLVESYFGIQYVSFRLRNGVDLLDRIDRWWNILLPAIATPAWLASNRRWSGTAEPVGH
jgi:AcrR family transcriptional regulator